MYDRVSPTSHENAITLAGQVFKRFSEPEYESRRGAFAENSLFPTLFTHSAQSIFFFPERTINSIKRFALRLIVV